MKSKNCILVFVLFIVWTFNGCFEDKISKPLDKAEQESSTSLSTVLPTQSPTASPILTPTITPGSGVSRRSELARNLIVKVTTENDFGAGIIFGIDDGFVFIATTDHIVRKGMDEAQDIQVEFKFWPIPIKAKLLVERNEFLDLAVLLVNLQKSNITDDLLYESLPFDLLHYSDNLNEVRRGYPVGHSPGLDWFPPRLPADIYSVQGDKIYFDYYCDRGSSGGGLFDDHWNLVGMIRGLSPPLCEAVSFEEIYKSLKDWGFPVGLTQVRVTLTPTPTPMPMPMLTPTPTPTPMPMLTPTPTPTQPTSLPAELRITSITIKDARGMIIKPINSIYSVKIGETVTIAVDIAGYDHDIEIAWIAANGQVQPFAGETTTYKATQAGGDYIIIHVWDKHTGDKLSRPIAIDVISSFTEFISKEDIPEFPWPPPKASTFVKIPKEFLPEPDAQTYLKDVAIQLEEVLNQADYEELSWYSVPDGFALVSQIEQFHSDGTPKQIPDRWAMETSPIREFSLRAYFKALFTANPGHYRIFVFIVTPYQFSQSDEIVAPEKAANWTKEGFDSLPESIGQREYSKEYNCTALIYEFEKEQSKKNAELKSRSYLSAKTHLMKSKIWDHLARK